MKNILFSITIPVLCFTMKAAAAPPPDAFSQSIQNCQEIYNGVLDPFWKQDCMGGITEGIGALAENPTNSSQALLAAIKRCDVDLTYYFPAQKKACKMGVSFYFRNSQEFPKD